MPEIFINILFIILGFTIGYCTRAVVYALKRNKRYEQIMDDIKLGIDETESSDSKEISNSSQISEPIDEIVEGYYDYDNKRFYKDTSHVWLIIGKPNKVYVDLRTNKTYIYDESQYVEIAASIALGETESDITKEIPYERYSDTEIVHCGSCAKLGTMACPYDFDMSGESIACSLYHPE